MRAIRANVREATDRRYVGASIESVVANLTPVLRGWGAYFRRGNSARKFGVIDQYVHERLAIVASTNHGRHGRDWQRRYTWAWAGRLVSGLGSTVSAGERGPGLRMLCGERCRKAGCGRTACPV
jgi:hypothetical protein